jgi:hypothetical protein
MSWMIVVGDGAFIREGAVKQTTRKLCRKVDKVTTVAERLYAGVPPQEITVFGRTAKQHQATSRLKPERMKIRTL